MMMHFPPSYSSCSEIGHLFNAYSKWRDVRFLKAVSAMYSKWFFERSLEVKEENLIDLSVGTRVVIGQFCGPTLLYGPLNLKESASFLSRASV